MFRGDSPDFHFDRGFWRRRGLIGVMILATLACQRGDGQVTSYNHGNSDGGRIAQLGVTHSTARPDSALVRAAIRRALADSVPPKGVTAHRWRHVRNLYTASAYAPLWIGRTGASANAKSLVRALAHADDDGLRLSDFGLDDIDSVLATVVGARAGDASPEQVTHADVLLSSAFATYGEIMLRGRVDPRQVQRTWHIELRDADVDSVLASALQANDFQAALAKFRPDLTGYSTLRQALAQYRGIVAKGGWPQLPNGTTLRVGDSGTAVPILRQRLAAEGLITGSVISTDEHYDSVLAGRVAAFQALHGLATDSTVGPGTLRSLNIPATRRVDEIAANMERYRWLPHDLGGRYIVVNIPAFHLSAFDNGRAVLRMKVVVGATYGGRATPIFSDSVSYVDFGPYWNVPSSITRAEILPKVRNDRSYLARNNYEIVTGGNPVRVVPLSSLSQSALAGQNFRYRIRQRPGPRNALGRVKFIFPNNYNVYLHDTPQGQLFGERVRAFSHGCIRVEQPGLLAQFLLERQGWTADAANAAMNSGKSRRVDLEKKVPVYIAYFTTFARQDELAFRPDLYRLDDTLIKALGSASDNPTTTAAAARLLELVGK
ncbi:MAG: L,D-transpeptidase family protein [Gemmatimonadaceae bacterium]